MIYKIADIEDQIIATLQADTGNFSGVRVDTYAGQVSAQMFQNPEFMQGMIQILPFCLISYQGRTSQKMLEDSSGKTHIHTLRFRLYIGAKSTRSTKEAVRGCYPIMSASFEAIHSHCPATQAPQEFSGVYDTLSGTPLAAGNHIFSVIESEPNSEELIVNIPGIVCYRSDYTLKLLA